jgi:hypothetical protein
MAPAPEPAPAPEMGHEPMSSLPSSASADTPAA